LSALVLDSGAFVAVDRGDRGMIARLRVALRHGMDLRTHAMVVAQVWRDPSGRQAELSRLLRAVDVRSIDEQLGREAGLLLARTKTSDPIDATVALIARDGDCILTSDVRDLKRLAAATRRRLAVVPI